MCVFHQPHGWSGSCRIIVPLKTGFQYDPMDHNLQFVQIILFVLASEVSICLTSKTTSQLIPGYRDVKMWSKITSHANIPFRNQIIRITRPNMTGSDTLSK
jgi:hypothetical protein